MGKKKTVKGITKEELKKKAEVTDGEQIPLMDVVPENSKEIIRVAKAYKLKVRERMTVGEKEKELKEKLRGLLNDSGAERLDDGKMKLNLDGFIITVTPRDELIQVEEKE